MAVRLRHLPRLLKLGAVGGIAFGVVRTVMRRRSKASTSESSWPTLAETAERDGRPLEGRAGSGTRRINGDAGDAAASNGATDAAAVETVDGLEGVGETVNGDRGDRFA